MSTWTITTDDGRVRVTVPDGWVLVREDRMAAAGDAMRLLNDLDRSTAGRHLGDVESQDPSGVSQGNPFLTPGQRLGTDLSGNPIVAPDFAAIRAERRSVTADDFMTPNERSQ